MSSAGPNPTERMDWLIADATEPVASENSGVATFLGRVDPQERDTWALVAAAVDVAIQSIEDPFPERLPEAVRARVIATARERGVLPKPVQLEVVSKKVTSADRRSWREAGQPPRPLGIRLAWIAASIAVAVAAATIAYPEWPRLFSSDVTRAARMEGRSDTLRTVWAKSAVARFAGVTGYVLWSDERQRGFLRFRGLPPNDSSAVQYQLWLVDPERDRNPTDGGVFDATEEGELIVPIDARLPVRPVAFVVTEERPGGVVVSDGPHLLVATLDPR